MLPSYSRFKQQNLRWIARQLLVEIHKILNGDHFITIYTKFQRILQRHFSVKKLHVLQNILQWLKMNLLAFQSLQFYNY